MAEEQVWKPHMTVAAVIERAGRFLIVEERSDGRVVYNQPAGHLDPGESLAEAAVRETLEETGHRFHPEALTGIYRWVHPEKGITFIRACFTGHCEDPAADAVLDDEIIAAHWLTRDELVAEAGKLRSAMVLRCIDDYLAGDRYPLALLREVR